MNGWLLASGLVTSTSAAGHAIAGPKIFYRPIRSAIGSELHAGVFTGMWQLITTHFILSAAALFACSMLKQQGAATWLIAAQFAAYAAIYLFISSRLGGLLKLFQRLLFATTAGLAAMGALTP